MKMKDVGSIKIFSKFFNPEEFKKSLSDISYTDFSIFVDDIPKTHNDLSSLNILVLAEPNEYFGLHEWAIQNKNLFSVILTWSDKVLNNCENAIFLPFGSTWFKPDQYEKKHKKEFKLSHLSGVLLKSYGHQMRHEIIERENEFKIPTKFYKTIGDRHNEDDARIGKETVFSNSQYGVAIENFSHRGYFSEKILDCFLMKTIPVYNGCSNIDDYFNPEGIIIFKNVDDLIYTVNNLDKNYYNSHQDVIEKNYQKSIQYINYKQSIVQKVKEIFKLNNL
jgi:hypothetical protein